MDSLIQKNSTKYLEKLKTEKLQKTPRSMENKEIWWLTISILQRCI